MSKEGSPNPYSLGYNEKEAVETYEGLMNSLDGLRNHWEKIVTGIIGVTALAVSCAAAQDQKASPSDFLPATGEDNGTTLVDDGFMRILNQGLHALNLDKGLLPFNPQEARAQGPDNQPPLPGIRGDGQQVEMQPAASLATAEISAMTLPIASGVEVIPSSIVHDPQGVQNEAHVAVSPCDNNLVVTTMNYATKSYGDPNSRNYDAMVAVSRDAGQTWQTRVIPGFPADAYDESQGDPTVAFTAPPTCRLIYSGISFNHKSTPRPTGGTYAVTSDDGGNTWRTPILLDKNTEDIFIDKPWLATNPTNQSATACWGRLNDGWRIYCRQSADGGLNWNGIFRLDQNQARPHDVGVYPYYGRDGRLYISLFDFGGSGSHESTNTVFYRQEINGSFTKRVIATQRGWLYILGMMPSVAEDTAGTLHLTWGDGTNVWQASSNDKGYNWTAPQVFAASPGRRFAKPWNCADPLGRVFVGKHMYENAANTLQVHGGLIGGEGLFPVGPEYWLVGNNIDDWDTHRQAMGDYNGCSSNQNPVKPGVIAAFTVERPTQSTPPGYIPGADDDVHYAEITTVSWAHPGTTVVFRPSSGQVREAALPVLNEGIESGQFYIKSINQPVNCPSLGNIPTADVAVSGRKTGQLPLSVDFTGFDIEEDRYCNYNVSIGGGYNPTATTTLRVWLGIPKKTYLPISFK